MNYKNIKLNNESNQHLTKRLNRLSSWQFFKVLYRVNMGKMMGANLLFLPLLIPIIYFIGIASINITNITASLPMVGSFGIGTSIWNGVDAYLATVTTNQYINASLWCIVGALPLSLILSGGFAIIRDAFWTGKLNVFSSMGRGIKANFGYAAVSSVLIASIVAGILNANWAMVVIPSWLRIVVVIALSIIGAILTTYLLIICSVSVTYKQSIKVTLWDSWYLLWLNIIPNLFKLIVMSIPVLLYLFLSSTLQILAVTFILMMGVFYIPFVWQTHMMKTFALFHPVEVNKKGETKVKKEQLTEATAS